MKTASAVPELDPRTLSEDVFHRDYVANSRPCVIRGAVKHWSALEKWRDKEYLKSRSGQHPVSLFLCELHVTKKRIAGNERVTTFGDAIERLHSAQTERGIVGFPVPPEILSDVGDVSFLGQTDPAFWYHRVRGFFYRRAGTAWHIHQFDETLTCQIIGRKTIGLVGSANPYNFDLRYIFYTEDYYDDPTAFADLEGANLPWYSVTLEEGDALYIPPLWWHGVAPQTETFGITTAVTWRSPPHVIANGIIRMARGEIDMFGKTTAPHFQSLVEVARKMGLERELAIAASASPM
ncbi:MAG: cupin-like domain-containing protein [Rhodospirillaceae bacterium]|nr:cupin-like domain-containing protein [Rhodospirillaceae bacterium]